MRHWIARLRGAPAPSRRTSRGSAPYRERSLVGKVPQMTLHRGVVAPTLGASRYVERQRRQRKENKNSRPSDFGRADAKQHHDREADDSGVQPRAPQRARRRRRYSARRFGAAAIAPPIEPLENRHA